MSYDYDSLSMPVSKREIFEYKKNINKVRDIYSTFNLIGTIFGIIVGLSFAFIMIATGVFPFAEIGVGILCITAITALSYYFLSYRRKIIQDIKLQRFANLNNLKYDLNVGPMGQDYPGMIFNVGYAHIYQERLSDGLYGMFEISNYRYTISYGKNSRVVENGYVMIKLDRNLPNIVLDSNKNNFKLLGLNMSNLPVNFKNNQKLSLEGDFNNYFTLYVPTGYERDALYVFTPDLMGLLVDSSEVFDAEIVDDKLFIYSKRFDMTNPETLGKIFRIIDTVGKKVLSQTDKYCDEKVVNNFTNNIVASKGTRLTRKVVSTSVIVSIVIFILINYLLHLG